MKKTFLASICTLFVLMVSCNDNDDDYGKSSVADLLGQWSDTFDQGDGKRISSYTFMEDSTYEFRSDSFGFNGKPLTELTGFSEISGVFEVEGDSLILRATQSEGFFKSKFWIKGDVLHLEYISYPADAPVLTQMEYDRVD
ncbi:MULTISPECIES: hypothetical protein [Flagellimonas]|uniref:Lipocalin-like domain-containing protein n=1 Tax=Flagellimonas hadalis TaxID=2597517 RepID=A0A5N5ILG0_9FLAO|nr:hypothetical protein [Allomuricauda hadalis]KAB5485658.1 hypothetical protein FOT42_014245 [Allomuricauda hadalis]RUA14594.1 MAG: hypothetical protein DSY83_09105 [Flavobacteriia bacterium]